MKDIARKAEVLGVQAHLTKDNEGNIRVALPAFTVNRRGGADVYYWAGSIKNGQIVVCKFKAAKCYLEQAVKLPADALPSDVWES